jgi:AcrR family transcriptional regulator
MTSTTPTRRTQAERRETARTQFVQAAIQTVLEVGIAATTTTEIQRRAGRGAGALYHYWPSKNHLLGEVVRSGTRAYQRAFDELLQEPLEQDLLQRVFDAVWKLGTSEHTIAAQIIATAAGQDPALGAILQEDTAENSAVLGASLERLVTATRGRIHDDALSVIVYAIQGVTSGPAIQDPTVMKQVRESLMRVWSSLAITAKK